MLLLQRHIRNVRRAPRLRLIASYYITGAGPLNILFFGRDDFSCKTLEQLWSARDVWRSIHLVTTEDEHIGRGRKTLSVSPLKTMGQSLQVPIHELSKDDASLQKLPPQFSQPGPNNVLVSASYGRAVPNSILSNFEHRLNVHPSLIPKYRGAAPIQWTIANGDETTGVSIIRMEDVSQGFDTGDIYASKAMEVPTGATYPAISPILAAEGGHLLADVLRKLIKKEAVRIPQDPSQASKARMIRPGMFEVDWAKEASVIERWHRAVGHQKPLWTSFTTFGRQGLKKLQLLEMNVVAPPALTHPPGTCVWSKELKSILIHCGNNTALAVQKVKPDGRSIVPAWDWWNGVHRNMVQFQWSQ